MRQPRKRRVSVPCRWYKKVLGIYQGALEYKKSYVKEFLKQTRESIVDGSYDTSKIEAVLDLLVAECTAIAVSRWDSAR